MMAAEWYVITPEKAPLIYALLGLAVACWIICEAFVINRKGRRK